MPKRNDPEQFAHINTIMNRVRDREIGAEPGTHDAVDGILEKDAELKKAREEAGSNE